MFVLFGFPPAIRDAFHAAVTNCREPKYMARLFACLRAERLAEIERAKGSNPSH